VNKRFTNRIGVQARKNKCAKIGLGDRMDGKGFNHGS
jgi:hypothetical protein